MTCKACGSLIRASKWDRVDRPRVVCSRHCRGVLNGSKNTAKTLRGAFGKDHPRFKNGRFVDRDGYVRVLTMDHPFKRRTHYMLEHVKVAESQIGRRITASECVHHKNGVRDDNRPQNLILMSRSAHSKLHWESR